jgi:uncharacterized membrane protein YhaH (DUF805 family)
MEPRQVMNPFNNTIDRLGYLVWNLIFACLIVGFGVLIDITKSDHKGSYWLVLRIIWVIVLATAYTYIAIRRLQNAGYSFWWVLLSMVPFASTILWLSLFFIPPKDEAA